jgi:hypothetical protein
MSPCCGVWHAGRYGSTVLLNSSECSGPCAPGYYCPIGSTLALAQACGNATVYCPSGSALPSPVLIGWYTTPDGEFDPVSHRSSAVQCAAGEFCVGGIRAPCEGGKYSGTPGQTSCAQCLAGMCWRGVCLHSQSCMVSVSRRGRFAHMPPQHLLVYEQLIIYACIPCSCAHCGLASLPRAFACPGFACPQGTGALTVGRQGCTSPSTHCPAGSAIPIGTPSGFYATGTVVGLYSSVTECEAGRCVACVGRGPVSPLCGVFHAYSMLFSAPPPPCVTRPCRNLPPCSSLGQVLLWRCGCSLPRGSLWQRDSADVHGVHRAVPRGLLLRPGIGVSHPSAVLGGRSVLLCRGTCGCPAGSWWHQ